MAVSSLLTLLDDIASIMDDVAVLSKVAAKKTSGVLGDDLALNAEQVTGFSADRELPVVFKVGLGSLVNKAILIPAALLLSQFAPFLIAPVLFAGGSYLCFEGFEKVWEKLFHKSDESEKPVLTEKQKVMGAIRTDFILSLEVIVIVLGTVAAAPFITRLFVLTVIGLGMSFGVYGLVAAIVKIDDAGLWLQKKSSAIARALGRFLLKFAPLFMKFLGIAGTVAMFLVGGAIVAHVIPPVYEFTKTAALPLSMAIEGGTGIVWGGVLAAVYGLLQKLRKL